MKYEIAKRLKNAAPGFLSGGELGRLFGVSRTAVWKCMEELRGEGYSIEAVPRLGYRFVSTEDRLNSYEISSALDTKIIGRRVFYFDTLDSTNNYARKIAAEGCPDGTVVAAAQQTAGRGRLGRNWDSPPDKGIYISVVLKPPLAPLETPILTLAAAVAAADAVKEACGIEAGIKWPNDLVIEGKKVCGILVEMSSEADRVNYVVVGIGINYSQNEGDFPEELRGRAISIKAAAEPKTGFNRLSIVRSLLYKLDEVLQLVLEDKNEEIIEMWRNRSITLGREVSFSLRNNYYTGKAVDITVDGRLLVDCSDGTRRELLSGEVSIRGIYGV